MSEINYGDLVTSVAQEVANKLDKGNAKGARESLQNELRRMSPEQYNRLLREVSQREQKVTGSGYDISIINLRPEDNNPKGAMTPEFLNRDSFVIIPSLPEFRKDATTNERGNSPHKK
jgi:hypothetical protein